MALGKSVKVRSSLIAPNAYHRIKSFEFINDDVPTVRCYMEIYVDDTSKENNEDPILKLSFVYSNSNLLTGNIMQRLYNHLKTLTIEGVDYTKGTIDI